MQRCALTVEENWEVPVGTRRLQCLNRLGKKKLVKKKERRGEKAEKPGKAIVEWQKGLREHKGGREEPKHTAATCLSN